MPDRTYCLNCHRILAPGQSTCPTCGSAWRCKAVPAPAPEDPPWHVRQAGELLDDLEILAARLVAIVVSLRSAAHVSDRVRQETIIVVAEQLAACREKMAFMAADLAALQQALAATGG